MIQTRLVQMNELVKETFEVDVLLGFRFSHHNFQFIFLAGQLIILNKFSFLYDNRFIILDIFKALETRIQMCWIASTCILPAKIFFNIFLMMINSTKIKVLD